MCKHAATAIVRDCRATARWDVKSFHSITLCHGIRHHAFAELNHENTSDVSRHDEWYHKIREHGNSNTPSPWRSLCSLLHCFLSPQLVFLHRRLLPPLRSYGATSMKTVVRSSGPCRLNAREKKTSFWSIPCDGRRIGPRQGASNHVCFGFQTVKRLCLTKARMDVVPALSVGVRKSWNATTTMKISPLVTISKHTYAIKNE